MLKSIEEVYCIIDEIVNNAVSKAVKKGIKSKLTQSECITLLIEGHKRVLKDRDFIQHFNVILLRNKGYIASEEHRKILSENNVYLIAKQRDNMDPYLKDYYKPLLKKRRRIESIFGYLKTRASLILPFLIIAESFIAHVKVSVITLKIDISCRICYFF